MSDALTFGNSFEAVATRSWSAGAFSVDDAEVALIECGWRVSTVSGNELVATRGSRLQLRLLGAIFARVRKNMPIKLRITFDDSGIHAQATPNPGWYLFAINTPDLYMRNAEPGFDALDRLVEQ